MKKVITFFELLQMKKDGNAPDAVMYHGARYYKTEADYLVRASDIDKTNGCAYLSTAIGKYYSMSTMLEDKMIEFAVPILTDKEKEYLSAVLKPFKDKPMMIIKNAGADGMYYIHVEIGEEWMTFPIFHRNQNLYVGMIDNHGYTAKELGLWEEE